MRNASVGLLCIWIAAGCAMAGDDSLDSSSEALTSENLMSSNLLSSNLLSLNLLSSNLLSSNLLSSNNLALNTLASNGMENTNDGRELLKYLAKCSLPPGKSLVVHSAGVDYSYPGLLSLAPNWGAMPLNFSERRTMSGCLLAHVNAYGVSVPISVRLGNMMRADTAEAALFPVHEASFYGNVFDGQVSAFACVGTDRAAALAQSPWRQWRSCADAVNGNLSVCNIAVAGSCATQCDSSANGYRMCKDPSGAQWRDSMSVFLSP